MASPRSSADEGEIVEGHGAEYSKAKKNAAGAALSNDVDSFSIDRRGRSSRSPPRGLKRQRDDRGDRGDRGGRRGGRRGPEGQRYQGRYDDEPAWDRRGDRDAPRASDRRRDRRYEDEYSRNGRNGRNGRDSRDGRDGRDGRENGDDRDWPSRRREDYRHDADRIDKRRRTRSRSPTSYRPSDGRSRVGRDDRNLTHRFGPRDSGEQAADAGRQEQQQPEAGASRAADSHAQPPAPLPQEDWVEQTPADEEAEIERRRQRREEILRKWRVSTPMLAPSVQADMAATAAAAVESTTQVNTPQTGDNTPRSVDAATASPATPLPDQESGLDLANDQDFMNVLGKHNIHGTAGDATGGGGGEDGPSAADYDPTRDMEEDERREELRHGHVAGLHGAERRASLVSAAEREKFRAEAGQAGKEAGNGSGTAVEEDDDDDLDMFAEDFIEKLEKAEKADKATTVEAAAGEVVAATANGGGGGILQVDDPEGYYKIRQGEVLDGRYQIQTALGKGMFSGVARACDLASPGKKKLVAIKIMRNNDALRKGGYTEIAILQKLNAADGENKKHIVRFERAFDYRGHLCMAFENLSMNLREVLKKFGNNVGINLHGVRVYAYQIFVALAHMRRCSIIHADLKPDNILVNDARSTLKICDLGTAIDRADAATAHMQITPYLVSRFYRAPEIILGMPYDASIDMWSIGCTLYELYTGKILFTGESNNQMLKAIMEVRGKMSPKLYRRGQLWQSHFDDNGSFLSQERDKFQAKKTTIRILPAIKTTGDLRTRLMSASVGMDAVETRGLHQFYDLLDHCLRLNPNKRILPSDALKHPFFTQQPGRG